MHFKEKKKTFRNQKVLLLHHYFIIKALQRKDFQESESFVIAPLFSNQGASKKRLSGIRKFCDSTIIGNNFSSRSRRRQKHCRSISENCFSWTAANLEENMRFPEKISSSCKNLIFRKTSWDSNIMWGHIFHDIQLMSFIWYSTKDQPNWYLPLFASL